MSGRDKHVFDRYELDTDEDIHSIGLARDLAELRELREHAEAEAEKEERRIARIKAKKTGVKKPSRLFAEAYAAADKILARRPTISDMMLLLSIEKSVPPGTNLPSERQLRRYRTGN
jgi:hypothetical protein